MRWNDAVELLDVTPVQDGLGAWHEPDPDEAPSRLVLCNPWSMSVERRASAADVGMRPEAQVQVRACEYAGETKARYHGATYDCEASASGGDLMVLTLGRRLADV